jgi:hypothetical protein
MRRPTSRAGGLITLEQCPRGCVVNELIGSTHRRPTLSHPLRTVGIDLGDRKGVVCVLAVDGQVCDRATLLTTPVSLERYFSGCLLHAWRWKPARTRPGAPVC